MLISDFGWLRGCTYDSTGRIRTLPPKIAVVTAHDDKLQHHFYSENNGS